MSEAPLMNDEAARSQTGEILDQATPPTQTQTSETQATTQSTQTADATPAPNPADKPAEGDKPAATTQPAVPDKYEFTVPEGTTIDPAAIEAATPIFKELGLSQEAAQKLVNFQLAREAALLKSTTDTMTAMRTDWQGKLSADAELTAAKSQGKLGLEAVKLDVSRMLNVLPADLRNDLRDALNLTGAGDHPAVVKSLWKLSSYITEGKHVTGNGPSPDGQAKPGTPPPSIAARMYPNLPTG